MVATWVMGDVSEETSQRMCPALGSGMVDGARQKPDHEPRAHSRASVWVCTGIKQPAPEVGGAISGEEPAGPRRPVYLRLR